MRVLITGITGFVGRHLAPALEAAGHRVWGLATDLPAGQAGDRVLEADVRSCEALRAVLERVEPEAIIHLGGLSHVGDSWRCPGEYLRVNFVGTTHLVELAAGAKLLFASSAEVYGRVPEEEQPIDEERALEPRSPYAMTKACAETVTLGAGGVVVRCFNIVGPGQSRHFALPSFAAQLAAIARREREPVLAVGDLTPRRDFVHVADAVAAYRVLLEAGEGGAVYNVASGRAVSIAQALERLRDLSGVEAEVRQDPERVRPSDLALLCGDNRRLRALGWEPRRCLDEALTALWQEAAEEGGDGG